MTGPPSSQNRRRFTIQAAESAVACLRGHPVGPGLPTRLHSKRTTGSHLLWARKDSIKPSCLPRPECRPRPLYRHNRRVRNSDSSELAVPAEAVAEIGCIDLLGDICSPGLREAPRRPFVFGDELLPIPPLPALWMQGIGSFLDYAASLHQRLERLAFTKQHAIGQHPRVISGQHCMRSTGGNELQVP